MELPEVTSRELDIRYPGDLSELASTDYLLNLAADIVDDLGVKHGQRIINRLESGALTLRTYYRIVCNVVFRVARNPEGVYSEQLGNYMYKQSQKVASGYMEYLPDELLALLGDDGVLPVGSVNMQVTNLGGGSIWHDDT